MMEHLSMCLLRKGCGIDMNWKQFKDHLEEQGVTDDMLVEYIDVHLPGSLDISIDENEFSVSD